MTMFAYHRRQSERALDKMRHHIKIAAQLPETSFQRLMHQGMMSTALGQHRYCVSLMHYHTQEVNELIMK